MAQGFLRRSQAAAYLQGNWKRAVLVQAITALAELLLMAAESFFLYRFANMLIFCVILLIDLLLVSPLKAGRGFFYETLTADKDAASIKLLFRFYRHGYRRSVAWRLQLWTRRLILNGILCVPSSCFLYFSKAAEQNGSYTLSMVSFALFLLFMLISFVATEILLFRYIPSMYLLTQVVSARYAFSVSKRITKGYLSQWILLYLDYAGWCFSFLLLFPFFYVSPLFQVARAVTVKRLFLRNSQRIGEELLQHGKNHGRIRNEF